MDMFLKHPKTGSVFEVPDSHGEMLLKQKFYSRASTPVLETKVQDNKRPRKNGRSNKQGRV